MGSNGSNSCWELIQSGVPQVSVLGPLLFLIYINDLEAGIKSSVKFFADDTSLFSIVRDPVITADELNHDLGKISIWAHQWKMSFNPDPLKQAEEIIFSRKLKPCDHPPIYFNNVEVKRVENHKHLGLILDTKLNFKKYINDKIAVARKGIGVIKHLSPYLPLKSRDQIYKMFVRPHLDFCDIIYHIPTISNDFDSSLTLNYHMSLLESTQYQAALAVSGTWKGTSTTKIYEELGWESLTDRRWFRRLIQFFKIHNNLTPEYLKIPLPPQRNHLYGRRSIDDYHSIKFRTDRYRNSFYPDSVNSWNNIGPELRSAGNLSIFKRTILNIIRPAKKSLFGIVNPNGTRWIYQLRVGLSPLKSHKKSHHFLDTPNDICSCLIGAETIKHFILKCNFYNNYRRDLFQIVDHVLLTNNINICHENEEQIIDLLLYGHKDLPIHSNQTLLNATINFISKSGRF